MTALGRVPWWQQFMLCFNASAAVLSWLTYGWLAVSKADWTLCLPPLLMTAGALMHRKSAASFYGKRDSAARALRLRGWLWLPLILLAGREQRARLRRILARRRYVAAKPQAAEPDRGIAAGASSVAGLRAMQQALMSVSVSISPSPEDVRSAIERRIVSSFGVPGARVASGFATPDEERERIGPSPWSALCWECGKPHGPDEPHQFSDAEKHAAIDSLMRDLDALS